MLHSKISHLAGIQYSGLPGVSKECRDAVIRLLQYGDKITHARILTHSNTHCLLLTVNAGDLVVVKSGFSSGYAGEGPSAFSYVLQLLFTYKAEITEYDVAEDLIERLDGSALDKSDIEEIERANPIQPSRWPGYVSEKDRERNHQGTAWGEFPPVIPFAIIDNRIADLALSFWQGPDDRLLKGYRRLEDIVRKRTGINEHGAKLFSQAFHGENPKLTWGEADAGVQVGRVNLFTGAYSAYRNPRAHRESDHNADKYLVEFLLLNHLYLLERQSHKVTGKTRGKASS